MIIGLKNFGDFLQDIKIWEDFYHPALSLTDKDEISVEELRKKDNCPVEKCLEKLRGTQKVFYKEEGGQWAFSLRKG